jgi:hypothetical protein
MENTIQPLRSLLTVRQLNHKYPAWSEPAFRALILNAEDRTNSRGDKLSGNGLNVAIIRCGRKLLLDERLFLEWVAEQSKRPRAA